ncbi:MAG: N-acetylmuramoyl-L-alanine amidase [Eubacteriales bacterium]|nr:N-acetylmuramoyl-L-alanine amidase [Eubacteriales bacterium]MDD3198913.1 N-acetylmuramoyl-L-alanine amidase [Eubacteriales bacterium]MDD4629600.1 N-acetylmuramoyl-L-alanine amidase [Eubacteriales bacterium]
MTIKIFIDQGHNPVNPNAGAEVRGIREQDINYEVGVRLAALLNENPNFEARLSRNSPTEQLGTSTTTSLQARVYAANSWPADFFISLHCNVSDILAASGSEAYVFRADSPAYYMATRILEGINYMTGLANRGVMINTGLYVLRATAMPAVLVEMGFMSNPVDLNLLVSDPQSFARGIYYGILAYYGLL